MLTCEPHAPLLPKFCGLCCCVQENNEIHTSSGFRCSLEGPGNVAYIVVMSVLTAYKGDVHTSMLQSS